MSDNYNFGDEKREITADIERLWNALASYSLTLQGLDEIDSKIQSLFVHIESRIDFVKGFIQDCQTNIEKSQRLIEASNVVPETVRIASEAIDRLNRLKADGEDFLDFLTQRLRELRELLSQSAAKRQALPPPDDGGGGGAAGQGNTNPSDYDPPKVLALEPFRNTNRRSSNDNTGGRGYQDSYGYPSSVPKRNTNTNRGYTDDSDTDTYITCRGPFRR